MTVPIAEAVARIHASARGANATLIDRSLFNVVVFLRQRWSVRWSAPPEPASKARPRDRSDMPPDVA